MILKDSNIYSEITPVLAPEIQKLLHSRLQKYFEFLYDSDSEFMERSPES